MIFKETHSQQPNRVATVGNYNFMDDLGPTRPPYENFNPGESPRFRSKQNSKPRQAKKKNTPGHSYLREANTNFKKKNAGAIKKPRITKPNTFAEANNMRRTTTGFLTNPVS